MRYTEQLGADQWVSECRICPKRSRRHIGRTQQAVDLWWAEHVESKVHQGALTANGEPSAEERLLRAILGQPEKAIPAVRPSERRGEVFVRPNVRKLREI